ncbi:F0F1 ATP synthase subunit delta [Actinomycetota bacterium]
MRGSSRVAALEGQKAFDAALESGVDWRQLSEELFAVSGLVDGNATLRRAMADPSREGDAKRSLVERLLQGKVSDAAVGVVGALASQRWGSDRDLTDTIESVAVQGVLASAEAGGRADRVEDELFRFERIVAANPELRDNLTNRQGNAQAKAGVVSQLLEGKAAEETVRLARQAVLAPRGRKLDATLESYLRLAAGRRDQLTAVVTSAVALDEQQAARLSGALEKHYGKSVLLQQVVDPAVVGGIRVQIGDEVVDGTVARKLEGARRHLTGDK